MKNFRRNFAWFLLVLIIVEITVFFVNINREKKYQSEAKYMITVIENENDESMSPYTSATVSNRIANLTSELVSTSLFIEETYWKAGVIYDDRKISQYQKQMGSELVKDTEIVRLWSISDSPDRAKKIVESMIEVMEERIEDDSWLGNDFEIKIIDPATTPYKPISPNFLRDTLLAFLTVTLFGGLYFMIKD